VRCAPCYSRSALTAADALHNVSRLLAVEARPYSHVTGHILKPDFFEAARPSHLPSPPPDATAAEEAAAAVVVEREQQKHKIELWRRNIMNELSALDFAILRAEFTTDSNHTERERYAVEKDGITAKQQHVRDAIEGLRVELVEAKETLAVRKTYDELAEKISSSKMLKTRDARETRRGNCGAGARSQVSEDNLERATHTVWPHRGRDTGNVGHDQGREGGG
jgi:hypothetical protein